jgi:exodeoxyribonuclease VII large subunit
MADDFDDDLSDDLTEDFDDQDEDEDDEEEEERCYTVPEFLADVNEFLAIEYGEGVWIEGEITGLSVAGSGHCYFKLADDKGSKAQVDAKIWKSAYGRLDKKMRDAGLALEDGVKVRMRATADVYPPTGRFSVTVKDVDTRATLGELALRREALLRRLRETGVTERNGRLSVPLVPLRLGVVSSAGAAGWADARKHLSESGYGFHVLFCDVLVQGDQSPAMVTAAIGALGARDDIDVILVMRGGGAKSDLAAFDEESVAMAIADCPKPVFTGIGHEIDRSIADEVAHTACKTPTACAAEVIAMVDGFMARLDEASLRITASIGLVIERANSRLGLAVERLGTRPRSVLERQRSRVASLADQVRVLDPVSTMARGWSITRDSSGRALVDAASVSPGEVLVTSLANGTITSTVTEVQS